MGARGKREAFSKRLWKTPLHVCTCSQPFPKRLSRPEFPAFSTIAAASIGHALQHKSDPPKRQENPNLFTKDFFEIAAERLEPDGLLCQWFHLYGMSEESTRSLIATFREIFPYVIAFQDRDLILIGGRNPLELSLDRLDAFYRDPEIHESLTRAEMHYPSDVLASMTLDADGTAAFSDGTRLNTDDNMYLELRAPRTLSARVPKARR